MPIYQAQEIVATLTIKANSKSEAEAKYNAYFSQEACPSCFPLEADVCECIEHEEEADHTMQLISVRRN
jgi:hypothetical protein